MPTRTVMQFLLPLLGWTAATCLVTAPALGQDAVADRVDKVLSLRADVDHGRVLYSRHCTQCHGPSARGDSTGVYPALAGQRPNYLLKQVADVLEQDRSASDMHRLMGRWEFEDPQSLRDVVTWLGDLAPNPSPQQGSGSMLAEGSRLYQSDCAACHGAFGEGDNPSYVPALRGQHYSYLKRQMLALAAGHRTGMDGESSDRLGRLSLSQLDAVADFISRMPSERDAVPDGNPFVPGGQ